MFVDLTRKTGIVALAIPALLWAAPAKLSAADSKKKKDATSAAATAEKPKTVELDISKLVFPPAPAVPRLRYLDYYSAEKREPAKSVAKEQKKAGWMDRLAGVTPGSEKTAETPKPRFQLLSPYGLAVDSKGLLYVADTKVGAIFIFNPENSDLQMIKNGTDARFKSLFGLAMDDSDNLLAVDGALRHVMVFDSNHKLQTTFGEANLKNPCGVAIDVENRYVYVADADLDQVLVYDADTYTLLRKIGTTGKEHTLRDAGNFSKPTNVAVDKDGNLYVTDTLNDRIEVFDADSKFVREFGKNGDGAGDFARPKGIAIDSDGHIWVADAMLNRIQVFTAEGQILMGLGGFGIMPAQFQALTGLAFDTKNNRLFTAEQLLGRVQMFRYYTNAEAKAELDKKTAELKKKADERSVVTNPKAAVTAPAASTPAAPEPAAAKDEGKATPTTTPAVTAK